MLRSNLTQKIAALSCALATSVALTACDSEGTSSNNAASSAADATSTSGIDTASASGAPQQGQPDTALPPVSSPTGSNPTGSNPAMGHNETVANENGGNAIDQAAGHAQEGSTAKGTGPTDPSLLKLVDTTTVVSSQSSVKCDVTRYTNTSTGKGEVHVRCMTENAPKLDYLPNCVPSPSRTPILMYNGRTSTLDCTTQGSLMSNVVKLAPGDPVGKVIEAPGGGGSPVAFTEAANGEIVSMHANNRVHGKIGPGRIELPS